MYYLQQFIPTTDESTAQTLFKQAVKTVHIEISSYCNRKCDYCPVSLHDRLSHVNYMENSVFDKIASDLSKIKYDGSISFALFSEPVHDLEYLLWRLARLRKALPRARFYINTNGDYLDGESLAQLEAYGIQDAYITLHLPRGQTYSDEAAAARLRDFLRRTGVTLDQHDMAPMVTMHSKFTLGKLRGHVFTTNYGTYGVTRGGLMANIPVPRVRQSPCDRPFADLPISYNGDVHVCCQMFAGAPEHAPYRAGRVQDSSLFAIFASPLMAGFRAELFTFGPKRAPCDSCSECERNGSAEEIRERETLYREKILPAIERANATAA